MTELQAKDKKRADEIQIAQIQAAKDQAKIEADKELALKELELELDAKSPKLPSFIDEKDELISCLLRFERYAEIASLEKNTWA